MRLNILILNSVKYYVYMRYSYNFMTKSVICYVFVNFSTPVTYGICLNELGEELTHKYQGRESSGRECNEIVLGPTGNAKETILL